MLLAVALILSFGLMAAPVMAATNLPYSETWGPGGITSPGEPYTVDVVIEDTGDGWLQWTYTYPESPTHTPKMTVAIDYPNGFCITTFDDGSHDGWYFAPDGGAEIRFADYSGGAYQDGVVTTAVGNVLTVRIKTTKLGPSPAMWHGYANVNGNQVWIEMNTDGDPWLPTGEVTYGTSVGADTEVLADLISISIDPTSLNFGPVYRGQSSDIEGVTIENTGTVSVDVSATTDSPFYQVALTLSGDSVDQWGVTMAYGASSHVVDAQVNVPSDWPAGFETGTIIFWAEATP